MDFKPRHTYLDEPALHYKKVIDIAKYLSTTNYYYYLGDETHYFSYDKISETFIELEQTPPNINGGIAIDADKTYVYGDKYYQYNTSTNTFEIVLPTVEDIMYVVDSNTYKGQKSRYIKGNYFDYTRISDVNENETQIYKGLIVDNKNFDIKYTNDDLKMDNDDIVQIDNELYYVSELSYKTVRLPKPYKTYFCTLTRLIR